MKKTKGKGKVKGKVKGKGRRGKDKPVVRIFRKFIRKLLAAQSAADEKLHGALHLDYTRAAQKLLPRARQKQAAKGVRELLNAWRQGNLDGDSDASRWHERQRAAAAQANTLLTQAFPAYSRWQTLRADYLKQQKTASAAQLQSLMQAQAPLGWRIVTPNTPTNPVRYIAPYALVDQDFDDHGNPSYVRENRTISTQTGYLIHDLDLSDDPFTWPVWGLASRNRVDSWVSCGVPHRMRDTGRLHIAVELQSHLGHGYITLRDRFGLSNAYVEVTLSLDVAVARSTGDVIHMPRVLFRETAISDGDDEAFYLPELEPVYQWSRTTIDVIPRDEQVTIHITPTLSVQSIIDDMTSHARMQFAWQLKSILTGVL